MTIWLHGLYPPRLAATPPCKQRGRAWIAKLLHSLARGRCPKDGGEWIKKTQNKTVPLGKEGQRGGALLATTGALAPQRSADRPAKRREFKKNKLHTVFLDASTSLSMTNWIHRLYPPRLAATPPCKQRGELGMGRTSTRENESLLKIHIIDLNKYILQKT